MTQKASDVVFLYVTAPDNDVAEKIASALIAEKLAACVNIHAEMRSIYAWNSAVEETAERPMIVKTAAAQADAACRRITALHPYDEPCVAALPVLRDGSSAGFLDWVVNAGAP